MAIAHAAPGQVVDVHPLGEKLRQTVTSTLVKADDLEVIRLVIPAGKVIPPHQTAGPITVQCLEGSVEFTALGRTQVLRAGQLLHLTGGESHALRGVEDSSVLVTILLRKAA